MRSSKYHSKFVNFSIFQFVNLSIYIHISIALLCTSIYTKSNKNIITNIFLYLQNNHRELLFESRFGTMVNAGHNKSRLSRTDGINVESSRGTGLEFCDEIGTEWQNYRNYL